MAKLGREGGKEIEVRERTVYQKFADLREKCLSKVCTLTVYKFAIVIIVLNHSPKLEAYVLNLLLFPFPLGAHSSTLFSL